MILQSKARERKISTPTLNRKVVVWETRENHRMGGKVLNGVVAQGEQPPLQLASDEKLK